MVELIGLDGLDNADVVDHLGQVRQHFRELGATLAVPRELEPRPQDGRVGANERIALTADDRGGQRLTLEPGQLGLGVKEVELAGCAGHEQVDHALGFGSEVRRSGCQRVGGRRQATPRFSRLARPSIGRRERSCRHRYRTHERSGDGRRHYSNRVSCFNPW